MTKEEMIQNKVHLAGNAPLSTRVILVGSALEAMQTYSDQQNAYLLAENKQLTDDVLSLLNERNRYKKALEEIREHFTGGWLMSAPIEQIIEEALK